MASHGGLTSDGVLPGDGVLSEQLRYLQEVMPASVERNIIVGSLLKEHLSQGGGGGERGWVSASILEECRPQEPPEAFELRTKILTAAIAFFPGSLSKLCQDLWGNSDDNLTKDLTKDLTKGSTGGAVVSSRRRPLDEAAGRLIGDILAYSETTGKAGGKAGSEAADVDALRSSVMSALASMRCLFDDLHPQMKAHVLHKAVTTAITTLPKLPAVEGVRPYDMYVKAIDTELVNPLRRDARITEDMLTQVSWWVQEWEI